MADTDLQSALPVEQLSDPRVRDHDHHAHDGRRQWLGVQPHRG